METWSSRDSIEPSKLAAMLKRGERITILSVGFPVLYRQKHIAHARLAGPASKPDAMARLRETVAKMPRNKALVVYCGCCPMVHCPNLGPAYSALREMGFEQIRVLNLPTNFHTDWAQKGYPVE